ncbi:MAG: discoidin domain-containing protein [Kiritimatiellae bacterium]|nr:discoidin domain-containing protein [Kiritimatiellia bacterium]
MLDFKRAIASGYIVTRRRNSATRFSVSTRLSFVLAGLLFCFLCGCTPPYRGDLGDYIVSARASSSLDPRFAPECAFDADDATCWISVPRDGEWVEARFDRSVRVERIVIRWGQVRAADYTILLGSDESGWSEVAQFKGAAGETDTIKAGAASPARALRVRCDRGIGSRGFSICTLSLFGSVAGPPPKNSLRAQWRPPAPPPEAPPLPLPPPAPAPPREEVVTVPPAPPPAPVPPALRAPPEMPAVVNDDTIAKYLLDLAACDPPTSAGMTDDAFLELVEKRTFGYFWWETNPSNGLTRDRGRSFASSAPIKHASIAAVGFALCAYTIGAERGWVSRSEALLRTRLTLRTFDEGPVRNVRGFFPHFIDMYTGADSSGTEVSTIDTALLLAGVIVAMEYFGDPEVTRRARRIFDRVDWNWAKHGHQHFVTHGIDSRGNFINVHWGSFNEGILIYLLALGTPRHGLPARSWHAIDRHRGSYEGYEFVAEHGFQSIFRYQYPALFYDFRGRRDRSGIDYFENVSIAVLAMREYCLQQARNFPKSYGRDLWGLGAADGLGNRYMIYGFPPGSPYSATDGSVVIYAIAGSLPFLPKHSLRALRHIYDHHRAAWGKYGFTDSLNPQHNFVTQDLVGLDAGATLLGIENYRSGMIWELFMRSAWVRGTSAQIGWRRVPSPADPDGPLDLTRAATWRFQAGDGDFEGPDFDDTAWPEVIVPDRWENMDPALSEFDGTAWYRAEFRLERGRLLHWARAGRPLVLTLGGVDDAERVYLNGAYIGRTLPGPNVYRKLRRYTLPRDALRVGRNVIAVQVHDSGGAGGIWNLPIEIGVQE